MKSNMDRREFIQKTGVATLGITSAFLIAQTPTTGEPGASINQSSNTELERWLLETGRGSLDRNLHTALAFRV